MWLNRGGNKMGEFETKQDTDKFNGTGPGQIKSPYWVGVWEQTEKQARTNSLVFFDLIKEKDLFLQNNNLYQEYSSKNVELMGIMKDQEIELGNLRNEIELLRAKNAYLK